MAYSCHSTPAPALDLCLLAHTTLGTPGLHSPLSCTSLKPCTVGVAIAWRRCVVPVHAGAYLPAAEELFGARGPSYPHAGPLLGLPAAPLGQQVKGRRAWTPRG